MWGLGRSSHPPPIVPGPRLLQLPSLTVPYPHSSRPRSPEASDSEFLTVPGPWEPQSSRPLSLKASGPSQPPSFTVLGPRRPCPHSSFVPHSTRPHSPEASDSPLPTVPGPLPPKPLFPRHPRSPPTVPSQRGHASLTTTRTPARAGATLLHFRPPPL